MKQKTLTLAICLLFALTGLSGLKVRSQTEVNFNEEWAGDGFMWGLVAYHIPFNCYELRSEDFRIIADNGIEWLSVDFAWRLIEPRDEVYDFSCYDFIVSEANRNGLKIIAKIGNGYNGNRPVVPDWTKDLSTERYVEEISEYTKKVVRRYKGSIYKYSIENEPNEIKGHVRNGWRVGEWNEEKVFEILKGLSRSVRSSDPRAEIILSVGTCSSGWETWLRKAVSKVDFDVIGIQPYPCIFLPNPYLARNVANDIRIARGYGKDVIVLETGYHTYLRSQQNQARYIEEISRVALNAGAKGVFFYEYLDGPDEPLESEKQFGLLKNNREPKLAWLKYGEVIGGYK